MAAPARVSTAYKPEQAFDMRSLWRLTTWGTAAAEALTLAAAATYSETGTRRLMAAGSGAGNAQSAQAVSRSEQIDAKTGRLADAVRALTEDRERLVARIDTLEHSLEDLTGSIRRERALPSAGRPAPPSPAAESLAASPAPAQPQLAAVTAPTEPQAAAPSGQSASPSRGAVTNLPSIAPDHAPEPAKPELGVDIGGAVNFVGLRLLWASARGGHAALFDGLHPVVAVRENSRTGSTELRLIAGPVADLEAATRMCTTLAAARRYCQPVGFEGQRLPDADAIPERKPPATPKPSPATPKLPRLLQ
jgi:hypothetical protein